MCFLWAATKTEIDVRIAKEKKKTNKAKQYKV